MSQGMKVVLAILGLGILVAVIALGWGVGQYNRVITLDEKVSASWAQVENQLKRRYDLIPNLVETVKGYATHERELFENIAEARTKYFQSGSISEKIEASNRLEGVLSRLLLLYEQYPQLKANESFLKLQDSLEGTENRIAVERQRYNESVRELNTYRRSFLGRFFASLADVKEGAYYQVPEAETEAPRVKF